MHNQIKSISFGGLCAVLLATGAFAHDFSIPSGELKAALDAYIKQAGVTVMYLPASVKGVHTNGAQGELSPDRALSQILAGTGFSTRRTASGAIGVVHDESSDDSLPMHIAAASISSLSGAALETVTVTSSKIGGDVQNIPISITALSQEQLTATQTAGGPDLIKQVPNMTFTKTNFSGYSIQLRGIGTQAISVTTDPAVAVAFNDIPFIRNHFFEQEFYDVSSVQVLRGPQGTLYGRNATAGVVNLSSAKPTDQFEAMASVDIGNYGNRRFESMINIPVVDDRLDVRIAGEWTKRQGYSFDTLTDGRVDGRDLWSGRISIGWKPSSDLRTTLVWEHFSEDDDRMRTSKQLCKTAPNPTVIDGVPVLGVGSSPGGADVYDPNYYISQGCELTSLYSPDAFEVPNGLSLAFASPAGFLSGVVRQHFDPYASTRQSPNLRVIESLLTPQYRAKNDIVELNTDYDVTPTLTATSQTGYGRDFLWSTEDYNRFDAEPGIFFARGGSTLSGTDPRDVIQLEPGATPDPLGFNSKQNGIFCDPQLGCSDRLVAQDLSDEHAWQLSQEFRLASNFSGPLNFSAGGNYLHYETEENYYVFINTLTALAAISGVPELPSDSGYFGQWVPGVTDNHQCLAGGFENSDPTDIHNPTNQGCIYVDPNPISSVNGQGHNYFLSKNPYTLNSYAAFGEMYYNVFSDLKLTGGLRWTEDQKHFTDIPSELSVGGYGYAATGVVDQQWDQFTGRAVANWTPKLNFTDQSLFYASYSHGYKAGGANPPGAVLLDFNGGGNTGQVTNPIHPVTFKPEFIDAFELGSKYTLLDGALTLNADVFYYNYENYQISEIVDRTSINLNFDAHVKGAEIESTWEPLPGLRFNFAGGWEDTALAKGDKAVDLMDRTAGNPDWMVVKNFPTQASNCIFPTFVVAVLASATTNIDAYACGVAYGLGLDPVVGTPYTTPLCAPCAPGEYPGFDPATAPNHGEGFDKDLSGNKLPNAPPFTVSIGTQYTLPITTDWAGTARVDYYWQDYSWARVFNDNPYDRLRGYTNLNLTLIFTNQNGWQAMLYDKNIFNETAITGTFLNSDDSGLTTNVFLTDPKLIGIRITKNW